uniref:C-type lectin domain-containing protein n=1 Tax=Macrostomum lignano TaxID=282301 RepID=A0A1I8FS41_9PLAT
RVVHRVTLELHRTTLLLAVRHRNSNDLSRSKHSHDWPTPLLQRRQPWRLSRSRVARVLSLVLLAGQRLQRPKTFEQAREDCRSRGTDVDLLWIDADEEETWWVDHSERSWNIKLTGRNYSESTAITDKADQFTPGPNSFPPGPLRQAPIGQHTPSTSTETNPTSITRGRQSGPAQSPAIAWIEYDGNCYTLPQADTRPHLVVGARCLPLRVRKQRSSLAETQSELGVASGLLSSKTGASSRLECLPILLQTWRPAWIGLFRDEGHDGTGGRTIRSRAPTTTVCYSTLARRCECAQEVGTGRYWYFCKAIGNYPATERQRAPTSGTGVQRCTCWIIPVLLVLAGATFYSSSAACRLTLESAEQPVMTLGNPAFSNYLAMDNAKRLDTPVNGDSVSVTLKKTG